MSTYLVTGGGRGLGLEFARQLARSDRVGKVFVTTRSEKPSEDLGDVMAASSGKVVHIVSDVTTEEGVSNAVAVISAAVGGDGLDVLINNIGATGGSIAGGIANMTTADLLSTFTTNVISAHLVASGCLPLLRRGKSKKIINISTTLGSMTLSDKYAWAPLPSYKITKAALNMLTVQYALDYGKEGISTVALTPGWIKTDLGSDRADLEVGTAVESCLAVIAKVDSELNGKFINVKVPGWENHTGVNKYDGAQQPW